MIGDPGTPGERPGPGGPGQPPADSEAARRIQAGFERFLSLSRLLALIPVVFLLLDAAASFIYGTDILVRSATGLIGEPAQVGGRLGVFLIVMDTFLVGATLLVSAFGFYELFIVRKPGDRYWLPRWLRMNDLEDLKARVVSMLILVVAITFVDRTVESHDEQEVFFLGLGISIVIVALSLFLWFGKRGGPATPNPEPVAVTSDGGGPAGGGTAGGGTAGGGAAGGPEQRGDDSASGGPAASDRRGPAAGGAAVSAAPRAALRLATAEDVPAGGVFVPQADGETAPARPGRLAAILGVARRDGGWAYSGGTALAVAGYARVDLRDADLTGPEISIRAHAVLGVVSIVIPPGMRVAESGVAVLGLRLGRGGAADEGPAIRHRLLLSGLCVLGVVRVRCDPGGPPAVVSEASAQAAAAAVAPPAAPRPAGRAAGLP